MDIWTLLTILMLACFCWLFCCLGRHAGTAFPIDERF